MIAVPPAALGVAEYVVVGLTFARRVPSRAYPLLLVARGRRLLGADTALDRPAAFSA